MKSLCFVLLINVVIIAADNLARISSDEAQVQSGRVKHMISRIFTIPNNRANTAVKNKEYYNHLMNMLIAHPLRKSQINPTAIFAINSTIKNSDSSKLDSIQIGKGSNEKQIERNADTPSLNIKNIIENDQDIHSLFKEHSVPDDIYYAIKRRDYLHPNDRTKNLITAFVKFMLYKRKFNSDILNKVKVFMHENNTNPDIFKLLLKLNPNDAIDLEPSKTNEVPDVIKSILDYSDALNNERNAQVSDLMPRLDSAVVNENIDGNVLNTFVNLLPKTEPPKSTYTLGDIVLRPEGIHPPSKEYSHSFIPSNVDKNFDVNFAGVKVPIKENNADKGKTDSGDTFSTTDNNSLELPASPKDPQIVNPAPSVEIPNLIATGHNDMIVSNNDLFNQIKSPLINDIDTKFNLESLKNILNRENWKYIPILQQAPKISIFSNLPVEEYLKHSSGRPFSIYIVFPKSDRSEIHVPEDTKNILEKIKNPFSGGYDINAIMHLIQDGIANQTRTQDSTGTNFKNKILRKPNELLPTNNYDFNYILHLINDEIAKQKVQENEKGPNQPILDTFLPENKYDFNTILGLIKGEIENHKNDQDMKEKNPLNPDKPENKYDFSYILNLLKDGIINQKKDQDGQATHEIQTNEPSPDINFILQLLKDKMTNYNKYQDIGGSDPHEPVKPAPEGEYDLNYILQLLKDEAANQKHDQDINHTNQLEPEQYYPKSGLDLNFILQLIKDKIANQNNNDKNPLRPDKPLPEREYDLYYILQLIKDEMDNQKKQNLKESNQFIPDQITSDKQFDLSSILQSIKDKIINPNKEQHIEDQAKLNPDEPFSKEGYVQDPFSTGIKDEKPNIKKKPSEIQNPVKDLSNSKEGIYEINIIKPDKTLPKFDLNYILQLLKNSPEQEETTEQGKKKNDIIKELLILFPNGNITSGYNSAQRDTLIEKLRELLLTEIPNSLKVILQKILNDQINAKEIDRTTDRDELYESIEALVMRMKYLQKELEKRHFNKLTQRYIIAKEVENQISKLYTENIESCVNRAKKLLELSIQKVLRKLEIPLYNF